MLKAAEAARHGAQQFAAVEGFGEVVVGTQLHTAAQVGALGFGGEENEGYAHQVRVLVENLKHAVAIKHRPYDVTQHEVGPGLPSFFDVYFPVSGRVHHIARQLQQLGRVFTNQLVVFNQ